MKLFELSGIKSYATMTGNLLMKMLERTGVLKKTLGRGAYGIAFELGDGEVLKVWARDPAYEKYIEFCQAHQSNPWLLKIKGKIQTFEMKHAKEGTPIEMKFVRVEMLTPTKSIKDFGYDGNVTNDPGHYRFFSALANPKNYTEEQYKQRVLSYGGMKEEFSSDKFDEFISKMYELTKELEKFNMNLDYHLGNFGMRGNQIVLLDPVAADDPIRLDDVLKKDFE